MSSQLDQRLDAQLEAPEATGLAGEARAGAPRYGISIGSFATPPFSGGDAPSTPWGVPHNSSMTYMHTILPKAARLEPDLYRKRCGHFDIVPVLLPSWSDPRSFLDFLKEENLVLFQRMLVSNAHQFANLARSCGGFENVALLGLATRDVGQENIITWWIRESYAHEPARAIFVTLAASADDFIDAVLFRYHPCNYLYPERTPSSVDGIKRNDLADSCFLSFVFGDEGGDEGKDGVIVSTTAIDAYKRDPALVELIAVLRAAHLRLLHEKLRRDPSPAQLAWWVHFGETYWARGTSDRSPGRPWTREEEERLLEVAEKESREWAAILKADTRSGKPIFAAERTARHLADKYERLIAAAAEGDAATGGASRRQEWTEEEVAHLVEMVKTYGTRWAHILAVDKAVGGPKVFAVGRTKGSLKRKHQAIIDAAARAAAAAEGDASQKS